MDLKEHKYLIYLYRQVDEYLSNDVNNEEIFADKLVSFCTVVEKILKIKLHRKNPILVFDFDNKCVANALIAIVQERESNIETSKINNILERFKEIFKNVFSDAELEALTDVYRVRNSFIHGYKTDDLIIVNNKNKEDILKRMGAIWEKISEQAIDLFGEKVIKKSNPKKKYTEMELERVLEEEVRERIKPIKPEHPLFIKAQVGDYSTVLLQTNSNEKCPRCNSFEFYLDDGAKDIPVLYFTTSFNPSKFSGLYKCKKCNLELTKKEYQIAKKINNASFGDVPF